MLFNNYSLTDYLATNNDILHRLHGRFQFMPEDFTTALSLGGCCKH